MDPLSKKHVTRENVTSEDLKPEGRTDGPKNFGPEFVEGPGGQLKPTRPAEHLERTAHIVAEGARAEGKSEQEVVQAFAGVMGDNAAPIAPSAQPVPEVVLGSMAPHDRAAHEKQHGKHAHSDDPIDQIQYDLGVSMANENKAEPLNAHRSLSKGYRDTRKAMKEALHARQATTETAESTAGDAFITGGTEAAPRNKAEQEQFDAGYGYGAKGGTLPSDAPDAARQGYDVGKAEFDAGVAIATRGDKLPDSASQAARNGYVSVNGSPSPDQEQYDTGYAYAQSGQPLPAAPSDAMKQGFEAGTKGSAK